MQRMVMGRRFRLPFAVPRAWVLFLRFGIAGLVNTAFGYGVFAVLVLAGLWPGAALVGATVAGVAFNYQTSQRLVFRPDRNGRGSGRGWRFAAIYAAMLVLNWAALRTARDFGLSALEAQALLTLPMAAISFVCQRAFVFTPVASSA